MRSTFTGLEIARRALTAQQTAITTTEHNVANANTEGYTRQRTELIASRPLPYPGLTQGALPGQIGMGVDVQQIRRLRDAFLDRQYREESAQSSYYDELSKVYDRLQAVLKEDSDLNGAGVLRAVDAFWGALDDLSLAAERGEVREQVIGAAESVTDAFRHIFESLKRISDDLDFEVRQQVAEINSITTRIADLNAQITQLKPHGLTTNDWEDTRDKLLDDLSKLIDISVVDLGNGSIRVTTANGGVLVDGVNQTALELTTDDQGRSIPMLGGAVLRGQGGALGASLEARDTVLTETKSRYDALAVAFVQAVNDIHMGGINLKDILKGRTEASEIPFFVSASWVETFAKEHPDLWQDLSDGNLSWLDQDFLVDPADPQKGYIWQPKEMGDVAVNPLIISDRELLAAAGVPPSGVADGKVAKALAAFRYQPLPALATQESFTEAYAGIIGRLGIDAQRVDHLREMKTTLVQQVDRQRDAVHGVSLDEEMTLLLQYQHAYSAAARAVTAIDQMLDKLINGTGLVGR
ncbi:MAG: Flagellar hook-associated protein FlgK [Candidatus Carbobacillus altaicus]|uniref:Flagellar hook-associated protein 1 n=1 Tax=Candidatus Carbonibacillus altaicus TaxID=2163959 RepID=A0A2R6Y3B2_9BACL|nr:MAG: Flagellar hook-associated protein FlgK [Candidatus Carbobacillus altaicus]